MRFRIIPNLEKNLRLLSFSQTNYGKACILAIYLTGLHSVASWLFPWIIAPYLIFTFASRFRSLALTITTLSALAVNLKNFLPFDIVKFDQLALTRWEWELFGIYILILALFFFYIRVYRRFSKTHLKHQIGRAHV